MKLACPVCGIRRQNIAAHILAKHPAATPDTVRSRRGRIVDAPTPLNLLKHAKPPLSVASRPPKAGLQTRIGKPQLNSSINGNPKANSTGHSTVRGGADDTPPEDSTTEDRDRRRDGARGWHVMRETDARWGSYPTHDRFDDESDPE